MTTINIIEDRYQRFLDGDINLDRGGHNEGEGFCINEFVAYVTGEPHSAAPKCVSPVINSYRMALNDRWGDEQRQVLARHGFLEALGTAGDGKDERRREIAREFFTTKLMGPWLELAQLGDQTVTLQGLEGAELRSALWKIRDAGWAKHYAARDELRKRIEAEIRRRYPAVVAGAAGVAGVAGVAVVAVDLTYGSPGYWAIRDAVKKAVTEHIEANPPEILIKAKALGLEQAPMALELLDLLIEAAPKAA